MARDFVDISSHEIERFDPVTDAEIFQSADFLLTLPAGTGRTKEYEKVYSLNRSPGCLLFDALARSVLPPSRACVDSFHCYYVCGGIAQLECGLIMAKLQSAGASLSTLLDLCRSAGWRTPGRGHHIAFSDCKTLLDARIYEDRLFRGSGKQTRALVFLLGYYVARLLLETGLEPAAAECFLCLKACCSELRQLQQRWMRASATGGLWLQLQISPLELVLLAGGLLLALGPVELSLT